MPHLSHSPLIKRFQRSCFARRALEPTGYLACTGDNACREGATGFHRIDFRPNLGKD